MGDNASASCSLLWPDPSAKISFSFSRREQRNRVTRISKSSGTKEITARGKSRLLFAHNKDNTAYVATGSVARGHEVCQIWKAAQLPAHKRAARVSSAVKAAERSRFHGPLNIETGKREKPKGFSSEDHWKARVSFCTSASFFFF